VRGCDDLGPTHYSEAPVKAVEDICRRSYLCVCVCVCMCVWKKTRKDHLASVFALRADLSKVLNYNSEYLLTCNIIIIIVFFCHHHHHRHCDII